MFLDKLKQFCLFVCFALERVSLCSQDGAKPHLSASTSVCGLPAYTTTLGSFTRLHCPPPMYLFQPVPFTAASLPRYPRA